MASAPPTTILNDPALYIITSLTAGSAHIVTATSRLETILRANRVPFKAVDIATNDKARMLWGRRAGKDAEGRVRKLPGLAQDGVILGDLVEIEEWNEYGELKQNVKIHYDDYTIPTISEAPKQPQLKPKPKPANQPPPAVAAAAAEAAAKPKEELKPTPAASASQELPVRSIADEAAQKAKEMRLQSLREKVYGKEGAKAKVEEEAKGGDKVDGDKDGDKADSEKTDGVEAKGDDKVAGAKADDKTDSEKPGEGEAKGKEKRDAEESGESEEESEEETEEEKTGDKKTPTAIKTSPPSETKTEALQSPTSAAWKPAPADNHQPLQSPTSTSWRTSPPERRESLQGAIVEPAPEQEISAVEKEEEIIEEPGKEGSDEDEESEDEEEVKEVKKGEKEKSTSQS